MLTRRSFLRTAAVALLGILARPRSESDQGGEALDDFSRGRFDGVNDNVQIYCTPKPIEGFGFPAFTGIRYCLDDNPVIWEYWDGQDWQRA